MAFCRLYQANLPARQWSSGRNYFHI